MPNLYIISGCNGAGKTTASFTVLPEMLDCEVFVNANEIARGLSPLNPENSSVEAGRMMLKNLTRSIHQKMMNNDTLNQKRILLSRLSFHSALSETPF